VVAPPFGLFGATERLPQHYMIASDGAERVLGSKEAGVVVNPGDHIICLSSGGGYRRLEDRDKEALTLDLKNGYVTG
jgi:N-methylhydantoinase B/oxoprolinase/acetone carboxylase alpha subunit